MKKVLLVIVIIIFHHTLFSQSWKVVSKMPRPVYGAVGVEHDSLIYIFGGYSDSLLSASGFIQIFDPRKMQWKVLDEVLINPRYGASGVIYGDKVYMFGGNNTPVFNTYGLEQFRVTTDESSAISNYNFNFNRKFATVQLYNNKIYGFGGYPDFLANDSLNLPYFFSYDLDSAKIDIQNRTDFIDDLPWQQMSALIGERIYVMGGIFNGVLNSVHYLDISNNSWHKMDKKLSVERYGGTATALDNNTILLIGGRNEREKIIGYNELFYINEQQDKIFIDSLMYPRAEHITIKYGTSLFVIGGIGNRNHSLSQVEELDLSAIETSVSEKDFIKNPDEISLLHNYPNPFNPSTTISFNAKTKIDIELEIFDITGNKVCTLYNGIVFNGENKFHWSGKNTQGKDVSSGIYFYRVKSDHFITTRRMILLR